MSKQPAAHLVLKSRLPVQHLMNTSQVVMKVVMVQLLPLILLRHSPQYLPSPCANQQVTQLPVDLLMMATCKYWRICSGIIYSLLLHYL